MPSQIFLNYYEKKNRKKAAAFPAKSLDLIFDAF